MKIFEGAVDRPLPVYLMAALVIMAGFWSLAELPVKRAPKVEIPFSVVYVPYIGATPDDVESEITIDLADRLSTLTDLRHQTAIASEGVSSHILEFEDRTDMDESLRRVRDEALAAEVDFPEDADAAVVQELSFDDLPIAFFTLTGGDPYRLRDLAEDLEPTLERVQGVSRVEIFGGLEREVKVLADPLELARFDLTLVDLTNALGRQSRSRPAGELEADGEQRLIRTTGEFETLEEIRDLVLRSAGGHSIQLRDVARVELGAIRRTSASWLDGDPSVTLIVKRKPDVNTMETVRQLEARVDELRPTLPPGVGIQITSNAAEDIARMIRQLGTSAGFGLLLVVLVLYSIFGLRRALLVGSVLPISLLFTFIGLRVFDMEISNIALFSLILVLGLVVDGAIIVGEAIYAEAEEGAGPVEAAKSGISRVGIPVISADLTTIAAFIPMLLMVGVMGQFMSVMPKVVCFAIAGSVFVDHFLLPAAAARVPSKPRAAPKKLAADGLPRFSPEMPRIKRRYGRALTVALRHRATVLAVAALSFIGAVMIYGMGGVETIFLPKTDQSSFTINYAMPRGTPLEETSRVGLLLSQHVTGLPELEHYVLTTGDTGALSSDNREGGRSGPEYGRISVELVEPSERSRSQSEVVTALRSEFRSYAGVEIDLDELSEGPAVGAALAVRVKGDDLTEIHAAAIDVERQIKAIHGSTDVRMDFSHDRPEIRVSLDRARAASRFGIAPDQVADTMLTAFLGVEVGRMWYDDQRIDIRVMASDATPRTLDTLAEMPIRAANGRLLPLGEIAELHLEFGKNGIFQHNGERTITIRADALAGVSTVALERSAKESLSALDLPSDVHLEFGGETEERDRSYASLWSALKWGLLLIYVVMAIQFNSLMQPFIVLLTVPLAIVGVTAGLLITGTPFSFMVFIGIVSLTGIVVNDGIVMVDAINGRRRAGLALDRALELASTSRVRPVMLTTLTTTAGLLPLTMGISAGGEFWMPLGVAIISGLLVSSMLTLFVVPILYTYTEALRGRGPRLGPANVPAEPRSAGRSKGVRSAA